MPFAVHTVAHGGHYISKDPTRPLRPCQDLPNGCPKQLQKNKAKFKDKQKKRVILDSGSKWVDGSP